MMAMGMTMLEKILAEHSGSESVRPGDIADISIDARAARDFGGANVVKHLRDHGLSIADPAKTFFTFDCNPTGSDQKYAVNQHICRLFARENGILVYDIDKGIGTHLMIDQGLAYPGSTAVSTDSHANILGAVGAFGQGMGDMDIAAAWSKGKVWFRVPESVRLTFKGRFPALTGAKDIVLNLLAQFGANSLLGYSVELCGEAIDQLSLDDRITISSMATEMGAIIILFPPSVEVIAWCSSRTAHKFKPVYSDPDAHYSADYVIDASTFGVMVSRPGEPHDAVSILSVAGQKIDSAFIGSCTNGRMSDMLTAASILKGRKVAPGVVLKIVPATDEVWQECLEQGLIGIFKEAGAMVSNAGCAGCAAGQVGQNGQGEVTVSTGNRNFPGKQGKGSVFLASPDVVAASAVAGYITSADSIPDEPAVFKTGIPASPGKTQSLASTSGITKQEQAEGRAWFIRKDNIDTDMIFHNRYLSITDVKEMGQYTFDNLKGYEDFAKKAKKGDIVVAGKNFGSGSSRQQAVDCFASLGIAAIMAESFGAIYERNAINAAFPVLTCKSVTELDLEDGDLIRINFLTGLAENVTKGRSVRAEPFSGVQLEIFRNGGLL
jgi:3-isopropylmalate/(R)-2-methylmalate dehydratase large subunit